VAHRAGTAAVVGVPNVGKSTLVNSLIGHKLAIVSSKPQTTRRRLLGILTRPEYQIAFVDTPGLFEPRHGLGRAMQQAAAAALTLADVVLLVTNVSALPGEGDERAASMVAQAGVPVVLVLNKMDRLPPERVKAFSDAHFALAPEAPWMMTTATKGHNLDKLLDLVVGLLPEGPPLYPPDQLTDAPERFLASELIREQVLTRTGQEVPHSAAVTVDRWEERPNGVVYIAATVFVEREGQKGILVGKGGRMLKGIGTAARAEITQLIARQVYLDLWVKVKRDWRMKPAALHELGIEP
jgi:GTP-binding protein Era